jgi:cephalosporin hydroxylase
MNYGRLIPRFVKSRLSFETKCALRRLVSDLPSSAGFMLNPIIRRKASRELEVCEHLPDLFRFAEFWLGGGPVQIPSEISRLLTYLNKMSPLSICEIGTESCGTSLLLCRKLASLQQFIGVDLFVRNMPRIKQFAPPKLKVHFVNGPSTSPRAIRKVSGLLAEKLLDVLFIDGNHHYMGVRGDFLAYSRLVRPGGVIVFHDIVPDYFARFGRVTHRSAGGVPQFWTQIKTYFLYEEFVDDWNQDGFGIGVLTYDPKVELPIDLRVAVVNSA